MTAQRREGWPDVAKGVCIILVVLWHVVTKHVAHLDWPATAGMPAVWTLLSALSPLRMPLFFLVSGLFAARAVCSPHAATAVRRTTGLISLYVLWLTIQTFALAAAPDFDTARATGLGEYLAQLTVSPTNLWYLLALAVYLVVARLTRTLSTPLVLGSAFFLACIASAGLLPDWGNLWQLVQNLFFFLLGLRLRGRVANVAASATLPSMLGFGAGFAAAVVLVSMLDAREWFGVWPLLSIVAVLFGVTACALLDSRVPWLATPLRLLGQQTLPVYVIHMIPLALVHQALRGTAASAALATPVLSIIGPLLLTTVVVIGCLGAHRVLNRLGLGVLFDPLVVARRFRRSAGKDKS
ncbi:MULTISPECIES: acyltransferase family protein [Actinoalloteichus]|uniref:Membrane protein n=1 Tax=Actinoalloteichus fjordicus TaxID=1612552 RepID=A0AAC9LGI1_9PSEU|nr:MULTISPECIES: acyltransferase family protein [Actinoalloteichus]APU15869.1 putative membrane protein [Actinoalloteichus fjordicus]APU21931.1 putative membrane protein [Actinoalloteichus sp. GBA129-24]